MKYVLWALSLVMLTGALNAIYSEIIGSAANPVLGIAKIGLYLLAGVTFGYLGCIAAFKSAVRTGKDWDRK